MIGVLVGRKNVEFVAKENGKTISYQELHVTYKDPYVDGIAVTSIRCAKGKADKAELGEEYMFVFDRNRDGSARLDALLPADQITK